MTTNWDQDCCFARYRAALVEALTALLGMVTSFDVFDQRRFSSASSAFPKRGLLPANLKPATPRSDGRDGAIGAIFPELSRAYSDVAVAIQKWRTAEGLKT